MVTGNAADADLYGMLGVPRNASARETRRAYRRLARQQHPDLNPGPDGPRRFAALAGAYEVLHDPARRARYDQSLGGSRSATGPPRTAPRPPGPTVPSDHAARRGILELSPREAAHLAQRPLTLRDAGGRAIVLPAGTGDGDRITLLLDGHPVVLTVSVKWTT